MGYSSAGGEIIFTFKFMKTFTLIVTGCFLLAWTSAARGQGLKDYVHFFGVIVDSVTREPLPGSVIYQISEDQPNDRKYTRFIVADKDGKFQFDARRYTLTRVEISCLGYKIRKFVLPMDQQTFNMGKVWLAPDPQKLDEVLVVARAKMYTQVGDTTRIFARSVKTFKGDALVHILQQIPGVKFNEDGSVSMNGQLIERTLLNDKLIFGDDNVTALYTIDAEETTTIDIYDEEVESETSFDKRKRKVMNIRTRKDINRYFTANALVEGGQDRDKDENGDRGKRYLLHGELGSFREGLQARLSAQQSDFTSHSFNDLLEILKGNMAPYETASIFGNLSRQLEGLDNFRVELRLGKMDTRNASGTTSTYFPTRDFESQVMDISSDVSSSQESYSFLASGSYLSSSRVKIRFNGSFDFNEDNESRENVSETFRDGLLVTSTNNKVRSEMDRLKISITHLGISWRLSPQTSMNTSFQVELDRSVGTGWLEDGIVNAGMNTLTVLEEENKSPRLLLSSSIELRHAFDTLPLARNSAGLGVGTRLERSRNYDMAVDDSTGLVNESRSGDYRVEVKTCSPGAWFLHRARSGVTISCGLDFNLASLERDGRFPGRDVIHETFHWWSPAVWIQWKGLNVDLEVSRRLPDIDLLAGTLDVSNPMFIRAGNPGLDQTEEYRFRLFHNLSLVKKGLSLSSSVTVRYLSGSVIYRRTYFENNTVLTGYGGYEAPTGSTLEVPVNGENHWEINVSSSMQKQISYLGLLETSLSYRFRDPQSEVEGRLARLREHHGSLGVKLSSNFSRNVRLNLENITSCLWSRNSGNREERGISNKLTAHLQLSFLERFQLESGYVMNHHHSSLAGSRINSHLLNATLGCRVFKDRKGLVSFKMIDILNRDTGFTTSVSDQYVSTRSLQPCESYYTLSFEYRFNSQK